MAEDNIERYFVSWEGFHQNLSLSLSDLVDAGHFADVTLVCQGDKQLSGHKVILSASSPFFKQILLKNPHPNPLIYLKNVQFEDLVSIINFMYLGEAKIHYQDLESFLNLSEELEVKGINGVFIKPDVTNKEKEKEKLLDTDIEFETLMDTLIGQDMKEMSMGSENVFVDNKRETENAFVKEDARIDLNEALKDVEDTSEDASSDHKLPDKSIKDKKSLSSSSLKAIFARLKSNDSHIKNTQNKIPKYKCEECERSFQFESCFSTHKNISHNSGKIFNSEKTFNCKKCSAKCKTQENLDRHRELLDHY